MAMTVLMTLYCGTARVFDGTRQYVVIGWHRPEENIPTSIYVTEGWPAPITAIPWDYLDKLSRYGTKSATTKDMRPYLAPTSLDKEQLSAFAKYKRRLLAVDAEDFATLQRSFDALGKVLIGIKDGTLTTTEQVDVAWEE